MDPRVHSLLKMLSYFLETFLDRHLSNIVGYAQLDNRQSGFVATFMTGVLVGLEAV